MGDGGVRVLVVDDEEPYRRIVRNSLAQQGWSVIEAATGEAAIDLARKEAPDAVILDFVLPDADGLVVLDALRHWGIDAPVIALSSSENPEVALRFVRGGVTEYLHKDRLSPLRIAHSVKHAIRVHAALAHAKADSSPPRAKRAPDDDLDESVGVVGAREAGSVLLVDDTADSRYLVRRILARAGWRVFEATDGAEALKMAQAVQPDVIVLDYLLPDTEGVQVLRTLRAKGNEAPVVALTGHGDERVAQEFILAGAADFLSKDDLPEYRLLLTLKNALALSIPPRTS